MVSFGFAFHYLGSWQKCGPCLLCERPWLATCDCGCNLGRVTSDLWLVAAGEAVARLEKLQGGQPSWMWHFSASRHDEEKAFIKLRLVETN